ncbi:uncharacterized protein LOC131642566 [Vicia villosa]|uniref:uncharacterized protein LOC131642566 n=1 Tax=Vicia villosa TaxID=3911 RepID=UPI00273B8E04|nr:uncharacterized protein LOC131642566 [Vicia villosa]
MADENKDDVVFDISDGDEAVGCSQDEGVPVVETSPRKLEEWVAVAPRTIASRFTSCPKEAFNVIEDLGQDEEPSWGAFVPKSHQRICSQFPGPRFAMYEFVFKEAGLRLPFTHLQRSVFSWLRLCPSQLHPNALAFLRAFEVVCGYLEVEATLPLFFRVFHLQRLRNPDDKWSWVSFKQPKKLFAIYQDSIKHFKSRYFIIKLLTHDAENHLFEEREYIEDGVRTVGPAARFPLEWQPDHFEHGTDYYIFWDEDLNERDTGGYQRLASFVDGFRPAVCTYPNGDPLVEEDGGPMLEPRHINTKAILECGSYGDAIILLGEITISCSNNILSVLTLYFAGKMADLHDKIVKMRAKNKGPIKLTVKRSRVEEVKAAVAGAPDGGSPSSVGTTSGSSPAGKKQKNEGTPELRPLINDNPSEEDIVLPSCTLHRGIFSKRNVLLEREEVRHIVRRDRTVRDKDLSEDLEGMMRVAALALALNAQRVCPQKDYDALQTKYDELEHEFEQYKDKYEVQSSIVEDLCKERNKVRDLEAEGERLRERIAELERSHLPAAEEDEDEKALVTRSQLLGKVRELEVDCVATLGVGFKAAVDQLKVLSPRLVTKGIGLYNKVVDGRIESNPQFEDWEDEQEPQGEDDGAEEDDCDV